MGDADEALLAAISLSLAPVATPEAVPVQEAMEPLSFAVSETKMPTEAEGTPKKEKNKQKQKKKKKKKKKKSKNSYKDFMKSMLSPQKTDSEARETHKNQLQQNLGGGAFGKIDRI